MVLYDECGFVGRSERVCTAQKLWWKEKEISGDSFLKKKNKKQRKHKLARKNFVFRVNIEKFYTDEEEVGGAGGDVSQLQNYSKEGNMQS